MHKPILGKTSKFFEACFATGRWQESTTKTVKLPETKPETFEIFLHWCYTGELVVSEDYDLAEAYDWNNRTRNAAARIYYSRLRALAKFADAHNDISFGNAVSDLLLRTHEDLHILPGHKTISTIYTSLPDNAPLRRLVVDFFHRHGGNPPFEDLRSAQVPHEFMHDLMMSMYKEIRGNGNAPEPTWAHRCDYHLHNESVHRCV